MLEAMQNFEFVILDAIQSVFKCGFMDVFMKLISTLGDTGIIWIALGIGMCFTKKYRMCGIAVLVGIVMGLLVGNVIIKNIVMRDRPCWINEDFVLLIENPDDYSFPSGHTLSSFISAIVIVRHNKAIGIPALVLAALTAFSRMYLYVHFPTDILGGLVLAVVIAIVVDIYLPKLIKLIADKRRKASAEKE